VWVSLRRCCEALGLDFATQFTKLKAKSWATIGLITTVAQDGKSRELTVIGLDSVPMWLATIDEGRVADEVKPKLVVYQKECVTVLRDHFFGKPVEKQDPVLAVLESAREVRLAQIETEKRVAEARCIAIQAREEAHHAGQIAVAALATAGNNPGYYSVLGFMRLLHREITVAEASQYGKHLTAICGKAGLTVHRIRDPRFGLVNTYPESVLESFFGESAN
jgi:hypothetical protein